MARRTGNAIDVSVVLLGLLALLPVAASVHYVNEYADVETDTLTTRTPFSGGSGAIPRTGISPRVALYAAAGSLLIEVVVLLRGWAVLPGSALWLLAAIGILGWEYSIGPVKFAWRGLGEVLNAIIGGILLPLYGFTILSGSVTVTVLVWVMPFGVLVFLNLLATQWPDRVADAAVGKRTLAVRWDASRLVASYRVGMVVWVGSTLVAAMLGLPLNVVAAYLMVAPGVVVGKRWFTERRSPLPAVVTMVAAAMASTVAWLWPVLA